MGASGQGYTAGYIRIPKLIRKYTIHQEVIFKEEKKM